MSEPEPRLYLVSPVEGSGGSLVATDRGRDFITHRLGEAESFLDMQEGLFELLTIVADSGPAQVRGFEEAWTEFLERHSRFRAPSSVRDTLRRRLNNLLDRGLIERERAKYTVTDDGLSYLERGAPEPGPRQKIQKLAKEQKAAVRECPFVNTCCRWTRRALRSSSVDCSRR